MRVWLWLTLLVVALDQGSKYGVQSSMTEDEYLPLTGFFNLLLVYNEGAAFSFLSDAGGWQRWFFVGLALVISLVLYNWLDNLKRHERSAAAALALILGGAWGNLIDRVLFGRVTDFIDLYYGTWHWPAFNLADSAITLGVVMLLIGLMNSPAREG
ncbi:MAG: lipoprotein signal peptidase [Gammaproteobacteria bacterium]|nr:lipoprotein signal peptidase [Gammaproteobacteria bacterium]MBU1656301.1 lipoprotein signal peptidase [Gammaproteobacteria bacterium]MBU1959866.1 lipoprotein signal peptidase [Gammaproteobacteria bacterium]